MKAIRRVLCRKGTWDYDTNFGSELYSLLSSKTPKMVSNDEVYDIVLDALNPMLQQGSLTSFDEVNIIDYDRNSITIRISVTVNGEQFNTTIQSNI